MTGEVVTTKNKVGRPSVVTDEVLRKLEEAFAIGASDREACFYADIGTTALYEYQERHPEFAERKAQLKERPVLLARQTVIKALPNDSKLAMDYLKAKRPDEFGGGTTINQAVQVNFGDLKSKYKKEGE